MPAALLTLLAALFFGALALLSQSARKSRGAEITLVVTLLAVSLLILLASVFIGIGLFFLASQGGPTSQRTILVGYRNSGLVGGRSRHGLVRTATTSHNSRS